MTIELDFYDNLGTPMDEWSTEDYIMSRYSDKLELLAIPEGRRALTKYDPLLFALIYFRHHLVREGATEPSFCQFHIENFEWARRALVGNKGIADERHCFVAPRSAGKSTFHFLLLPMWALAHGHRHFVLAVADTASQSEAHLRTFKGELETNEVLRSDFPGLVAPKKNLSGMNEKSTQTTYVSKNGAVFHSSGMTTGIRGAKIGNRRPDYLIGDDIESGEATYSAYQADNRLHTLQEDIFQLNLNAVVALVGTVTMHNSIIHQILKSVTEVEAPAWVTQEKIKCHYYPAIITDDNGERRSLWESKWSTEWLLASEGSAAFQKEMMNNPRGAESSFWTQSDFAYGTVDAPTRVLLYLDPAVTSHDKSDRSGISVVAHDVIAGKVEVREAYGVRLEAERLRTEVLKALERNPDVRAILVETNQGGDLWKSVLHDMPVPVASQHTTVGKPIRFAEVLNFYQKGKVLHRQILGDAEGEMISFPRGKNDDVADAVVGGVAFFLKSKPTKRAASSSVQSYV